MSMGGGGGGQSTTTVQKADPWSGVQSFLTGTGSTMQLRPGAVPITTTRPVQVQDTTGNGESNLQGPSSFLRNETTTTYSPSDYVNVPGTPGIYPEAARLYGQNGWTPDMQSLLGQQMQALAGRSGQVQQAQDIGNSVLGGKYDPNVQAVGPIAGADKIAAMMVDPTKAFGSLGAANPTGSIAQMLTGQANTATLDPVVDNAIQRMTQGFNTQVLPQLRGQAVASGQYGGSRQGIAEALASQGLQQQAGDMTANMYNQAYNQAQQNMYGTANNMAGLGLNNAQGNANRDLSAQTSNAANQLQSQMFNANLGLQNNSQAMQLAQQNLNNQAQGLNLLGTGNSLQDQNFQQQMNLQQMPGNFDWQNLGKYASIIQPGAGIGGTSSSTQNQPTYNNPLAGALGGAVGAAGLQSAMPSLFQGAVGAMGPQIPGALSAFGGPAGMALGAGLGLLGSFF